MRPQSTERGMNNEWYTPKAYIEKARVVMGGIDIDPASNDIAQEWIQATTYYTKETDGLSKEWKGKVWLNPPYDRTIKLFVNKLVDGYEDGEITEAILLCNNSTETAYFQRMLKTATAVCFPNHRMNFYNPDDSHTSGGNSRGQSFFYFGKNKDKFIEQFKDVGAIL